MGKALMFCIFMWVVTAIAGNVMQGQMNFVQTRLSSDITASTSVITVTSTTGFPSTGIVVIGNEHIAYSHKSSTTFYGNVFQPLIRGAQGTTAEKHYARAGVHTVESGMMNSAASYNVATIQDTAGALTFLALPTALFSLVASFLFLPLEFLGSDLQILTYFWAVFGIGIILTVAISAVGGRRVG